MKGTYTVRKYKRRKRPTKTNPKIKKNDNRNIITLTVNGLNAPTKRQAEWIQKPD